MMRTSTDFKASKSNLELVSEKVDNLYEILAEKQLIERERQLAKNNNQLYKLTNIDVFLETVDQRFKKEPPNHPANPHAAPPP